MRTDIIEKIPEIQNRLNTDYNKIDIEYLKTEFPEMS